MNIITYNIKKRFAFMPALIQTIIFLLCSAYMLIHHLLFMEINIKNWLNYLEEFIFWFFLGTSIITFCALIIRIFTFKMPSYKSFRLQKIIFILFEMVMMLFSLAAAIIFLISKTPFLGHDERDSFYRHFVVVVLFSMSFISFAVILPVFLFKNPNKKTIIVQKVPVKKVQKGKGQNGK